MSGRALAILLVISLPAAARAQDAGAGNGMIVEPTVLYLGETGPGVERTAPVTVTNTESVVIITVTGVNRPDTTGCAQFALRAPGAFPIAMSPAESNTWTAAFTGTSLGHHECQFDFLDDDGNPDFITVAADVIAPVMTVQPPTIGFGDVAVSGSASQRISISNDGTAPLTVSAIDASGSAEFTVMGPTLPRAIAPRTTEIVTVTYSPGAAGADTGMVTITGDDPAHRTATVALSGNGVATNTGPHIVLSPDPVPLGSVAVGANADAMVTILNDGGQPAGLRRIEISGPSSSEMTIEGLGCSGTQRCNLGSNNDLAAGAQVSVGVRCHPAYAGSKSATLVVTSTASNSPTSAALTCTGTAADIAVNPTTLGYGTVRVGASAALTFRVENDGNARLDYSIARIGIGAGDYTVTPACSSTCRLEPGAVTTHTVTFRPSVISDRNASLMISSNDPLEPNRTVTLTGVGGGGVLTLVAPVGGMVPFGDIPVEITSSPQPVRVRNDGNLNLRITSMVLNAGGAFAVTGRVAPPEIVLAPGRVHAVDVTCHPVAATSYTGTLAITSDAPVGPSRTVTFTCRGITADLAATPAPVLFEPTRVGASAVQRVTVRNTGNVATTITALGASPGSYSLEQGPSLPLSLAARATFTVDVRFTPTGDGDVEGALVVTPQSGDPLSVALRGPGRVASFGIDPGQGELGTVCLGQSTVQRFTLTSTGSADIEVSRPVIEGGGGVFELTAVEPAAAAYPAVLAPTAMATIDVTATPTAPTTSATLRIATDVMPGGVAEIALSVAAIADGVGVSPGLVEFGALPIEQSSEPIAVSLSNCGDAPLPILDLDIVGDDAAAFDVGGTVPPPAISVPVASSIRWTVVFAPTHAGAHSASLVIAHDGGMLMVPLSGMGTTDAPDAGPGGGVDGGAALDGTSYYACSCRAPASPGGAGAVALALLLAVRRRRRL